MSISETLHIINLTPVSLKTFLKYIFEMGLKRKFDFRRVWKFCWGLSNVISGDNRFSGWDCVFSGGILYPSANYELTWHIYHLSFEKNDGGRGRKQKSTKKCYEIRKISTFLLRRGGGGGGGGVGSEGARVQFLQKNPT